MFGDNPEVTAFRKETARRRLAASSPRINGTINGPSRFGPALSGKQAKALGQITTWCLSRTPTQDLGGDLNRLF